MVIRAILTLALLVPVAASAEDMFRWRDARGRVHYSNDTEKVPAGAQPVTKQIGVIAGEPIGELVEAPKAPAPSAGWGAADTYGAPSTCMRNVGMWVLPHRAVDFNHYSFFDTDIMCGQGHDIEAWLRRASTQLEFRTVGY